MGVAEGTWRCSDAGAVIAERLALILDIQADEWWEHVSYPMLEEVRRQLRAVVHLIERSKRSVIYSDFTDEVGVTVEIDLPGTGGALVSLSLIPI